MEILLIVTICPPP